MRLALLDDELGVARLDASAPTPDWASEGSLSSVTRTTGELSVVCAAAAVPEGVPAERGWRCLRVAGPLDLALTGVLASVLTPLAEAKLSAFALSTYETDYVLVRGADLAPAVACLRAAGHEVLVP
ncbi:MAG: ACT domain-containing protein [Candidatus Latescibacterota bacterium]